ncbi:MAG TPA: hypothetical protein VNI52_03115 [Sphingobacteriaceae bacterium]|nr:hypothetical protein [Sphingobacteriaceae bacterium]
MAFPVIVLSFLPAHGMALFPFILVKKKKYSVHEVLLNHERIHLYQQLELLIVPFYTLYFINYLVNLVRYRNHHKAYFNIIFEKEAFKHESNLDYLSERKLFGWIRSY